MWKPALQNYLQTRSSKRIFKQKNQSLQIKASFFSCYFENFIYNWNETVKVQLFSAVEVYLGFKVGVVAVEIPFLLCLED